jgi:transposase
MSTESSENSHDADLLVGKIVDLTSAIARMTAEKAALAEEKAALAAENEKLRLLLAEFKRAMFGRRSEKIDPGQLALGLEDVEQSIAANEAAIEATETKTEKSKTSSRPPRAKAVRNRGALPRHLPRIDIVIDVEDKCCPHGHGQMHVIGEDVAEMLDVTPAQYRVKRIIRRRWGCRTCEEVVVQAPAPEKPITGGMATEALLASVAVQKYAWHLPLYRQAQILVGQGINLDRATLAFWIGRTAWWVKPLYLLLLATILEFSRVFCDETPMPVLDPGRGRTKTGQFWAYAVDDRAWCGPAPPAVAYVYTEDRRGMRVEEQLQRFSGVLQVDGYQGYNGLTKADRLGGAVTLALCNAHARRKFHKIFVSQASPIAGEALRRYAEIYQIEETIRGRLAEQRLAVRQAKTKPLYDQMKPWLEARLAEISDKSKLAEAIRYMLSHWNGLTIFLGDGRIEIDSNTVERTIRHIALGKKNSLFAGSDGGAEHWAIFSSLINTAKLNGIDPQTYLTDVLERIVSGRTKANQLHELLPWVWKAARAADRQDSIAA